jgi:hypothetical protein
MTKPRPEIIADLRELLRDLKPPRRMSTDGGAIRALVPVRMVESIEAAVELLEGGALPAVWGEG